MPRQPTHRKPCTPREHALCILYKVESSNAYAHVLLQQAYQDLHEDHVSPALLTQLVKGTLEQRSRLDGYLKPLLKTPLEGLDGWTRNILRLGAYQVIHLSKIPVEVSVNESVELAKTYTSQSKVPFVNAVLRNLCRKIPKLDSEGDQSIEQLTESLSHPLWILELWANEFGLEETKLLCKANNLPWPTYIRANNLRTTHDNLKDRCKKEGLELEKGAYCTESFRIIGHQSSALLNKLPSFQEGLFTVQDESAALVSHLLAPQPGDFVVDLCSAPGTKATHLAALMANQGEILAVDFHANRLGLIESLCKRLGVNIVHTLAADGRSVELQKQADRILIDAPCSGLGTIGNKVDIRWSQSKDELPQLITLQKELLAHAAAIIRQRGRIVYSTCTINSGENQELVEAFLASHRDFRLISCRGLLPDELVTPQGYYQALPHRHRIAGAFAAILEHS